MWLTVGSKTHIQYFGEGNLFKNEHFERKKEVQLGTAGREDKM
jgi:hypothetical protein